MTSQADEPLNKAWKDTCRILLGQEVGELDDFSAYLRRHVEPLERRNSAISGKEVAVSSDKIPKGAPVIAYDEIEEYGKMVARPMDVDKIKDLDSLVENTREMAYYAGNIVLGNSRGAAGSHRCVNVCHALECKDVYDGKYIAYTSSIRSPEYSFGCCFGGDIQFCIKALDPYKQIRCMETFHCNVASDSYYSATLEDCTNCIFSFNQKNRHYMIGNVSLPRDRYAALKAKLVGEIADELRRKKSLPSIIGIISGKGG